MKIVVVVQARTGSTRLPNKVLLPLSGRPLLQRMVERITSAHSSFDLVVATTKDRSDDPIRDLCAKIGIHCHSGHPTDLLDRHYWAAEELGAEVVVKIPSDCPLIDPAVIDRVIGHFLQNAGMYDFVSNLHPASYPDGNDVEVIPMATLMAAWREATKQYEREHTTPFIWDRPTDFRIGNVQWETGWDYSMTHRWTIDYPEDYLFVSAVYRELWNSSASFSLYDVLDLEKRRPDIHALNATYAGVNWYRHHLAELKTVNAAKTRIPVTAGRLDNSP